MPLIAVVPNADVDLSMQLDPEKQKDLSADLWVYLEALEKRLQDWSNLPNPFIYLRAIILNGEASSSGMKEMRQALTIALPEYRDKLRMMLDPHYIGAFGAAQRARHIAQTPDFLEGGIFTNPPVRYLDEIHNEL